MGEIIVGLFAVVVGAAFCLWGNALIRIMFPIVGFFVGFSAGAGALTAITGDGFLRTLLSWVVGLVIGLIVGALAYLFYEFAIVLAFASLGFTATAGVLALLNLDWNWLVLIVGTVVGAIFGITAIAMQLPIVVLIMASAFFGGAMILYGLMLVLNIVNLGDFSNGVALERIRNNLGMYVLWLTFGIGGSIIQARMFSEETRIAREYWEQSKDFSEFIAISTTSGKSTKAKK